MSNAFLHAPFQVMLERINTSRELLEVFTGRSFGGLLRRLKTCLLSIMVVLVDAEQKEDRSGEVKHWLTELIDAFYQAEDVLDEISTEALRRKVEGIKIISMISGLDWLKRKIEQKLEVIVKNLESLVKDIEVIKLREFTDVGMSLPRQRSQHINLDVSESKLFGRDNDKQAIINLLLSDEEDKGLQVIPVVGMAGVGKTDLVQTIYKDDRILQSFNLKAWVSVGQSFDTFRVTALVLRELTTQDCDVDDLHSLQLELQKAVTGKKFLLVLDDYWSEKHTDWETFRAPFTAGASGSKIVLTTRSHVVPSVRETVLQRYPLKLLTDEDCWELFAKFAFGNKKVDSSYRELEIIGKRIARNCNGLPLAAKEVAAQLSSKPTPEEWISASKNLSLYTEGILPTLRISYKFLPAHLKRCFAFCSLFPKGYEFEKKKLVLLWMANDLLQQPNSNKNMEDIGDDYFSSLVSLSFFQQSNSTASCFVMHDVMNDLAKSISGEFCLRLEDNVTIQIPDRARHFSFSGSLCDPSKIFESIQGAKFLRTVLPYEFPPDLESLSFTDKVLHEFLLPLKCLRVLCLSHYRITILPESIGSIKHLRYLDLSSTDIRRVPDSICTLYNLQTLLLINCNSLFYLPKNIGKLVNLYYLDLTGTSLKEMPIGIKRLKKLHMLSTFVVGRLSGAGLREVKNFSYLRGRLCISELQNVAYSTEANDASLKKKPYLEELELKWSREVAGYYSGRDHTYKCDQREVLEMLWPHPNLKSLSIDLYGGATFPNWLGDSSFSNIVFLRLSNCSFCLSLPPVGQLPSLKNLVIEKLDRVQKVGFEFCGPLAKPFQSLETLKFYSMPRWEEWVSPEIEGGVFPCLRELSIRRCPKLTRHFPRNLPPSTKVVIFDSPLSISFRENEPARRLETIPESPLTESSSARSMVSDPIATSSALLQNPLEESDETESQSTDSPIDFDLRKEPPQRMDDEVESQISEQRTEISDSYGLRESSELSSIGLSTILNRQDTMKNVVTDVPSPSVPPDVSTSSIQDDSTERLKVSDFSQLMELPPGLHSLSIEECDGLTSLPEGLMGSSPYLQDLFIVNCQSLESFPGGHPPTALKTLYLRNCRKLEFIQSVNTLHQYSLLQYLYLVSSCDKLHSFPLSFFPNLKTLSIWDCADFSSITVKGGLDEDRILLEALEIRDCPKLTSFPPTPKLTSILLSNCKNFKTLPERLCRLSSLQSLFINECPELEQVPQGGFPRSLSTLCISNCEKFTPQIAWGLKNLDNLRNLEIEGGCMDIESFPEEELLPRKLYSLRISELPTLKFLDYKGLQQLRRLKTLEITGCNNLASLPDEGLPSSLSHLSINDCSSLKENILMKAMDWYKVVHIPRVEIDREVIS